MDAQISPLLLSETIDGTIETYTVTSSKGVPQRAFAIVKSHKGHTLARVRSGDSATMTAMLERDPIGRAASIVYEDETNYFTLA